MRHVINVEFTRILAIAVTLSNYIYRLYTMLIGNFIVKYYRKTR